MSTVAFIRRCMAAGMDWETALIAAEAFEESPPVFVPAKSKGAERTAKWRAKKAENVTRDVTVTECDDGDGQASPVTPASRARVVNKPPSEVVIYPLRSPSESFPPKPKNDPRGHRLPDDWYPNPLEIDGGAHLTPERWGAELEKFRDYWRAVPGAKGRKLDWDATWRNWLRRSVENSTPRQAHAQRPDAKRTAREANHLRALAGAEAASRIRAERG